MILQRQKNWCLLCLLCLVFVGCSSVTDFNLGNKFESRVRLFSQAIRWSEFEKAQGYIRMRDDHPQNQYIDYKDKIKVTKYQTTNKSPQEHYDEQSSDIILVYEIDYFNENNYKIKHLRYEQVWWYDNSARNWFLDSDLPKFEL